MVPWIEVLLHTWMDLQRSEDGERKINHHGKELDVGGGEKGVRLFLFDFVATFYL